jgi:diguanylate cyclase (GGDEF)-like protein
VVRERTLQVAASRDPLTGLCNRSSFAERLEVALRAPRTEATFAVAYLDVDHFKRVNDRFGHDVGDRFLVELGRRLEVCLGPSDTVARLGGDEFALLIHLAAPDDIRQIGSKLLTGIRRNLVIDGHRLQPSASIGFVVAVAGDTAQALIKRADVALYEAKASGRNSIWQAVDGEALMQTA